MHSLGRKIPQPIRKALGELIDKLIEIAPTCKITCRIITGAVSLTLWAIIIGAIMAPWQKILQKLGELL